MEAEDMAQIDYGMLFKAYRQSWYNESKISQMVWDVPQDYADFLSDFELYNSKFLEYGEPRGANFSKVLDAMVDDQRNISRRRLITIKLGSLQHHKSQVYLYNRILLSHKKNGAISFVVTWMDPEIIILSDVSQRKKDKYHQILLI